MSNDAKVNAVRIIEVDEHGQLSGELGPGFVDEASVLIEQLWLAAGRDN